MEDRGQGKNITLVYKRRRCIESTQVSLQERELWDPIEAAMAQQRLERPLSLAITPQDRMARPFLTTPITPVMLQEQGQASLLIQRLLLSCTVTIQTSQEGTALWDPIVIRTTILVLDQDTLVTPTVDHHILQMACQPMARMPTHLILVIRDGLVLPTMDPILETITAQALIRTIVIIS